MGGGGRERVSVCGWVCARTLPRGRMRAPTLEGTTSARPHRSHLFEIECSRAVNTTVACHLFEIECSGAVSTTVTTFGGRARTLPRGRMRGAPTPGGGTAACPQRSHLFENECSRAVIATVICKSSQMLATLEAHPSAR